LHIGTIEGGPFRAGERSVIMKKEAICIHEAGHVVAAWLFLDVALGARVGPSGGETGKVGKAERWQVPAPKMIPIHEIRVLLAGPIAEQIHGGHVEGDDNDMRSVRHYVRDMRSSEHYIKYHAAIVAAGLDRCWSQVKRVAAILEQDGHIEPDRVSQIMKGCAK
jgi:ATP-dependent Zn protease